MIAKKNLAYTRTQTTNTQSVCFPLIWSELLNSLHRTSDSSVDLLSANTHLFWTFILTARFVLLVPHHFRHIKEAIKTFFGHFILLNHVSYRGWWIYRRSGYHWTHTVMQLSVVTLKDWTKPNKYSQPFLFFFLSLEIRKPKRRHTKEAHLFQGQSGTHVLCQLIDHHWAQKVEYLRPW